MKSLKESKITETVDVDMVNHPPHYNFGRVETIDYIEDCIGETGLVHYCMGNALKYISRAMHKGKLEEDLEKATWYLKKATDTLKKGETDYGYAD